MFDLNFDFVNSLLNFIQFSNFSYSFARNTLGIVKVSNLTLLLTRLLHSQYQHPVLS